MKPIKRSLAGASVLAVCAVGLAACGGGGGGNGNTPTAPQTLDSVPAAASSSVAALVTWASQLPQSDVTQPLSTAGFTPPIDDTAEPMPLMI
jgi:hypothetical protein